MSGACRKDHCGIIGRHQHPDLGRPSRGQPDDAVARARERTHLEQALLGALRTSVRTERPTHEQVAAHLAETVLANGFRRVMTP